MASGRHEDLDTGSEALGIANISLDDVVEGGVGSFGITAVGVRAVAKEPLQRFRLEIRRAYLNSAVPVRW
jgi:hypothetical protein